MPVFSTLLRILSLNESDKLRAKVVNLLKNEKFIIQDARIEILAIILEVENNSLNGNDFLIKPFNLYLKGEYLKSQEIIEEQLSISPENPILLLLGSYVEAMINSTNNSNHRVPRKIISSDRITLKDTIVYGLAKIIDKGIITSSKEINELSKISLNFSSFPWASAINLVTIQENSFLLESSKDCALLALKIPFIHPLLVDFFKDLSDITAYEKICLNGPEKNIATNYYISLNQLDDKTIPDGLSINHFNFINAYINFYKKDYFIRRGYGLLTRSYLRLSDLEKVCLVACDCYINHRPFYPFLPLKEIFELIKPGTVEWKSVNSLIDLSIILDAYVKNIDKKLENERRFAYEDFLIIHGLTKPSQLGSLISIFDINKLIYYLRYVCIETTMETSGSFEGGSQEVADERLAICRLLVDIDKSSEEIHKQEIKDLVRRQIITSRRQEVDQSRIYVDIQSIKEWAESEIKENFERYIAYLKLGLNTIDSEKETSLRKTRTSLNNTGINTPDNETNELLRFMIEEIKDTYLSPEIGLDRFISTRIRHGDLERNMRSPIQKYNLITKKEFKNGPYQHNDYWLTKLEIDSLPLFKKYDQAFLTFSESYDNLIFTLTNEWLQIKKDSKPMGLFDFTVLDDDIGRIASLMNDNTTLKEFIELVITTLETTLILRLMNIREELNTNAKSQAKKLLNELQESTKYNLNSTSLELKSAINQARTGIQNQFEKIIEWFVPSSEGNSAPYIIEDAMVVAEAIIKEGNPSFKVNIESDQECSFSIHGHLPIFVDIFINIFENVVKRSGLDSPQAEVKIWLGNSMPDLKVIYIKVFNNLGANKDLELLDSELKRKKSLLVNESYSEYLATEGNSGFFKIHKSIMDCKPIGFESKPTMDFGLENGYFQITISVPFRLFVLDLANEN